MPPGETTAAEAARKLAVSETTSQALFARSAQDLALAMEVLTGRAPSGMPSASPRIGLCRTPRWSVADGAVQANLEQAARALAARGAQVSEFELPIMGYETARAARRGLQGGARRRLRAPAIRCSTAAGRSSAFRARPCRTAKGAHGLPLAVQLVWVAKHSEPGS